MNPKEKKLHKKLLEIFRIEADEHIKKLSSGLLELERNLSVEAQEPIVEVIFREAHSLKGAARSVNFNSIESICHSLESVFSAVKQNKLMVSPKMMDTLHQTVEVLSTLLSATPGTEENPTSKNLILLTNKLDALLSEDSTASVGNTKEVMDPKVIPQISESTTLRTGDASQRSKDKKQKEEKAVIETIRISTKRLKALMLQSEELLSIKLALEQRILETNNINVLLEELQKDHASISGELKDLKSDINNSDANNDKLRYRSEKLSGLLGVNETQLAALGKNIKQLNKSAKMDYYSYGTLTNSLLDGMKQILLQPVSTLLDVLPATVRDLARHQKKEVELITSHGGVQIDRRILEELKTPLLHIVRNSIDHGLEEPSTRTRKGKKVRGTITIEAARLNGRNVEIRISDDGAGIDTEKIKSAALKLKLISKEKLDQSDEGQISELVFDSGITSSSKITNVSGRGLGLAIVREKVENLGGSISLESDPKSGTTFRIKVPLTISTSRGIFVQIKEQLFVIATMHVENVFKMKKEAVKTVGNRNSVVYNGQIIPLLDLADALGIDRNGNVLPDDELNIIVIGHSGKKRAYIVDEVIGEDEIVIKSPGKHLSRLKNISGVTVLGDGKVVPILNINVLLTTPAKQLSQEIRTSGPDKSNKNYSLLVAEDSITARTLLKNILEIEGYQVTTAVDGMDAYTKIIKSDFDLVISDVDMPRLSGFELTQKIRSHEKLASLPVVLVTSLDSKEDREHGIDAGADAYIIKGNFDQSNLLQVIQQLL